MSMNYWRYVKGEVGVRLNGIFYVIDIIDGGCPVSCPSCAVGSIGRRKYHVMPLDLFSKILDKMLKESKVRIIQLYTFSDPTMVPNLHEYLEECRKRQIQVMISTVLQHPKCDFAKVIEARPREFRISFPGWKRMNYYQKGARPEEFDRQFAKVMKLPRHPETAWTLGWHVYNDNADEMPKARELAYKHDLKFVPLQAILMVQEKNVEKNYSEQDKALISRLVEPMEEEVKHYKSYDYCQCWKQLTIDARGETRLCQLVYEDRFKLAPFLLHPLSDFRKAIRTHAFCKKCIAAGANVYQEKYNLFFSEGDPVEQAERKRRKRT